MKEFSIRERIELPKRGFKIISHYCPGLIRTEVLSEAVSAVQPFVSVWLSAKIINELSSLRRGESVILFVTGKKYAEKRKMKCGHGSEKCLPTNKCLWTSRI